MNHIIYNDPWKDEEAFLGSCEGDRDLLRARCRICERAKQEGISYEEVRERMLLEHLEEESRILSEDVSLLQELIRELAEDPEDDPLDYMVMSSEDFYRAKANFRQMGRRF